jgi:hypothetical protein
MKGFDLKRPSIAPHGVCMPACLYLPVVGQTGWMKICALGDDNKCIKALIGNKKGQRLSYGTYMMGWRGCGVVVDCANDRSQQEPQSNGSSKFKPVSVRPLLLYAYRMGFICCCKMGDYGP